MKDPTRLLDAAASEHELYLLRAGAEEQPPAAAMQRLLEQLGGEAVVSKLQPAAATAKLSLLPIGMVALGITLAGVVWTATHSAPLPAAGAVTSSGSAKSAASASTLSSTQEPNAATLSNTPAAPGDVPQRRATPTAAGEQTSSIALEIARIDEVRRALAADRAKAAIVALQGYQRDFPQGVLRQEAEVLSIEAQRRAGDRRRARVLASRFLAEHPESPHSARVRDLLNGLGTDAR